MKIVFLSDDFPPQSFGGAGISTYDLAAGMKKAGQEVFVITTCRKKEEAGEFEYNGLRVFKIASDYPSKWRWYVSLYNRPVLLRVEELLKKIRPDVVHVNNIHFYLSYHSIKVAKRYAKVVVWTGRDVMAFNFAKLTTRRYLENFDYHTTWLDHLNQAKKRWNPFRNFFIKKYLRYADRLFAVSVALKDALEQNGIVNVEITHTGVDLSEWTVSQDSVDLFKSKHELENKKNILFGGRLSEAKGGQKVLVAMVEIVKEFPDARLLVTANLDGHTQKMVTEAQKLGIGDNLIFTGWIKREEMKFAYASADIVLVPSICFDSFPRTVLEAMASGKPVVGTCYGGAPEIIENDITGFVVNPFNSSEITNRVVDLFRIPSKRESFGKASRERVEAEFNIKSKIQYLISVYKILLDKNNDNAQSI